MVLKSCIFWLGNFDARYFLGLIFQALVFFGSALCSSVGHPFMYTTSSPLGFLQQMKAIVFIACKQAAAERAEKELAESEVAGGSTGYYL